MVGGTIEKWQTPNVDSLLSEDALRFLYAIGRIGNKQFGTFIYAWEQEQAITKTVVEPAQDANGRQDLLNRTIIVKFNADAMKYILDHTNIINEIEMP